MTNGNKRALLAGSAILLLVPASAWAQQSATGVQAATPPASASPSQSTAIPDIVVTAQRRDTSLSKTPVAVTIVGAAELEKAQIRTQEDLRSVAPGLSIVSGVSSNEINFALRGQSKDSLTDSSAGVLPYLNEVPIGGGKIDSATFYDLQSVQVLKGPQGTLFGRSAAGGAVLYTSTPPANKFGGYLDASVGDYDLRSVDGAINIPLVDDRLALRLSGIYRTQDGFQENIFPGRGRVGDTEKFGFRPSLAINLGKFHDELVIDYLHSDGTGITPVVSGLLPYTGVGPPYVPATLLYGGTSPAAEPTALAVIQAFLPDVPASTIAAYYNAYFAPGTGHPAGGLTQVLANQLANGPYKIDIDGKPFYHSYSSTITNTSIYDLNDTTKIKNVFGFTNTKWLGSADSDGTPFGLGNGYLPLITGGSINGTQSEFYRQFSEELQLQGTLFNDRLNYSTGFYFSDEHRPFYNHEPFFDILLGGEIQTNSYILNNREYAGYAQGTYKLNDAGLSATAGFRYTSDTAQKILLPDDSFAIASPIAPAGYSYNQSLTSNFFNFDFGIQDQLNPNLLVYANTSQAYKPGGFNGTVAPKDGTAAVAGDIFVPEKVNEVEIGTKFLGRIDGMPTRLTFAGYYNWIDNSQRLAFTLAGGNPSSLTVNVPSGTAYGFEFDGQISPAPWLTTGAAFNYIDASYGNTPVLVNGASQIYDQVPETPKYTGSVYADITVPITNDLSLLMHGDGYYQSVSYTAARSADDVGATLHSYAIANFRVGVQSDSKGWSLTANLKNAFNKVYYTGGLATGEIFQVQVLVPAEPRTFSVNLHYKF